MDRYIIFEVQRRNVSRTVQFAAHLGTVKERSSERDTTSEEKGEEITNGRHEAISSMMRADHHENQMRTREDRSTPMELSAQVL